MKNPFLGTGVAGHTLFAVLTAMAAWFWPERTLILDAAFQGYLFIAGGQPAIMVERFGAAAVQVLPLLGVWSGAPLATVLLLYSVSIVLFHWVCFSVCLHGLKDEKAALAILLFNLLLVGDSFYWMQNELLQAISLMFVLWSFWFRAGGNRLLTGRRHWPLSLLLAATVVYYHPLVFFPLAFGWCWLWLHPEKRLSRSALLAVAGLFALVFSSKYILRQPNFYDRGMTGQYVREFNFSLSRLLHSQSLRDFTAHLDDNLLLLLPVLALVTAFYIRKKQWALAALAPAFTLFYCLLIMQRFLADDRWYIQESHYQALAVFLLVPLVWDVLPAWRWNGRLVALSIVLIGIRIFFIWNTHHGYTDRLAYVRGILDRTRSLPGRKFVLDEAKTDRKTLLMYWGVPFETLQISALESPDSIRVVTLSANPDSLADRLSGDSMTTFLMIPPRAFRDLPEPYYRMRDTLPFRAVSLK